MKFPSRFDYRRTDRNRSRCRGIFAQKEQTLLCPVVEINKERS